MPLVITDVSSFDEAGAQLIRLDAHFQTDCRARRARLHHVLPSPRMRALKGMWRSVAAWEGKGLDVATYLGTIGAAIQEDSGTKTEVSHDEGFISVLHRGLLFGRRKNHQVRASLNSRATHDRAFRVGYLGFRAKICLEGCSFSGRCPLHSLSKQACPRALNAVPAISGVRPIVGGSHSQRRSRTLGERSKCVQEAILAGFPRRAENRTRT